MNTHALKCVLCIFMSDNTKKNYFWNMMGTTFVSFTSLILMILVTRINGIMDAGVFTFSFSSATIMNILALYCGRTYQVTENENEISDGSYLITRILTCFISLMICILFCVMNQYEIYKSLVFVTLCFYKIMEALIDYFYGLMQKNDKLYMAGISMTMRSILLILVFVIIDYLTKNLLISCISMICVAFLFLFFFDLKTVKGIEHIHFTWKKIQVKDLLKKASYTCIFSLISMIVINIPKYAIDYLSTNDVQAIYGIISMPATFIMLFGQFILQPSLVGMASAYKNKEKKLFNKSVFTISVIILASLIIILPVAYWIGIPVLNIIYGLNLNEYTIPLLIIIVGAAFYTISQILLNALITLRCTKEQMFAQFLLLFLSIVVSSFGVIKLGIYGSIYSYFTIMIFQFIIYIVLYIYMVNKKFNVKGV